jgi:carbamoyl-phosphate synthase large subunit
VTSIIITGVGGGVGQSVIKSLYGSGYRLVGVDEFPLAAGLYAVDKAYVIPPPDKPEFADRLLEIAKKEDCALLFPGLDTELPVLARSAELFLGRGVRVVVSDPAVVDLADDKLATAQFLERNGFPAPKTRLLNEPNFDDVPLPAVLKPRKGGARSHGVVVATSRAELRAHRSTLDAGNYVAQEQIVGDEYTCGTVNLDGRCFGAILMRRTLRNGDTYKAFVDRNPRLTAFVVSVAEALKPFGACNFQFRVRDGTPFIFEFNARCSGTTHSRTLAGFNEPLMIADHLLRGREPAYAIREITLLRYWNELVVDNGQIELLRSEGTVAGGGRL